jgi:arylsulfatase A-like enzyme
MRNKAWLGLLAGVLATLAVGVIVARENRPAPAGPPVAVSAPEEPRAEKASQKEAGEDRAEKADRDALRKLAQEFVRAFDRGDAKAIASFWTERGESYDDTGTVIRSRAVIEKNYAELFKKLDDLGIADNTIVLYSTDNGAETFIWPDGGTTPFRSEKNTNWEGGYRLPCLLRWPGVVKPGSEVNDIVSHEDWLPTLMAAAGEPDIKGKLLKGYKAGDRTVKVHLDGYDQRDLLFGKGPGKRKEFFYWTDDGQLAALRYEQYKLVFMEQKAHGLRVW